MSEVLTVTRRTADAQITEHHLTRDDGTLTLVHPNGRRHPTSATSAADAVRRHASLGRVSIEHETEYTIGDPDDLSRADLVAALTVPSTSEDVADWDDDDRDDDYPYVVLDEDASWACKHRILIDGTPVFALPVATTRTPHQHGVIEIDDPTYPMIEGRALFTNDWDTEDGGAPASSGNDGIYRISDTLVAVHLGDTEIVLHKVSRRTRDVTIVEHHIDTVANPNAWLPNLLLQSQGFDANDLLSVAQEMFTSLSHRDLQAIVRRRLAPRQPT